MARGCSRLRVLPASAIQSEMTYDVLAGYCLVEWRVIPGRLRRRSGACHSKEQLDLGISCELQFMALGM